MRISFIHTRSKLFQVLVISYILSHFIHWGFQPIQLFVCHIADCEFGLVSFHSGELLCMVIHPSGQISRVEGGGVGVAQLSSSRMESRKKKRGRGKWHQSWFTLSVHYRIIWQFFPTCDVIPHSFFQEIKTWRFEKHCDRITFCSQILKWL